MAKDEKTSTELITESENVTDTNAGEDATQGTVADQDVTGTAPAKD